MKKIITALLIIVITLTSCNNSGSSDYSGASDYSDAPKSAEELKMELEYQEKSFPTDYLKADGTYKENFFGGKLKIDCTITNNATTATYKDAVLRVTYYSQTETALSSNDYTIYEMFPPNSSKTVEMKIDNYDNVGSIGWEVVNAVAVD